MEQIILSSFQQQQQQQQWGKQEGQHFCDEKNTQQPPRIISFEFQHAKDRWGDMHLDSPLKQSRSSAAPGAKTPCRDGSTQPVHSPRRLACPEHSKLVLAERRPFDCGMFVFHPVCPQCVRGDLFKDSANALHSLDLLIRHYSIILQLKTEKSPPLRRFISELRDIKCDIEEGVRNIEALDLETRFVKALPEIERLVRATHDAGASKPTVIEQLRFLGNDLNKFHKQLVRLSDGASDCCKAALFDVTKDIVQQLVCMELVSRQDELLTSTNVEGVFEEFEKLQLCVAEVTKTMSHESFNTIRSGDKLGKKRKGSLSKMTGMRTNSKACLDAIPECSMSAEDSSARSDDPMLIQTSDRLSTRSLPQNPWDELHQHEDWEQSTVVSSSCSSTEFGMSVRNIVHRLKNCTGNDLSILIFLECVDDWCLRDDLRSIEFSAAGGISAIVHTMRVTAGNPNIQAKSCETLKYLAINKSNQPLITVVGGIETTLTAMSAYPNNTKIQIAALGALKHLCTYEGTSDEIVIYDGLDIILEVMHRHQGHSAIQRHACAVLQKLDWTEAGPFGVSVLFSCIRHHIGEGELQTQAILVLQRVLDKTANDNNSGPRRAIQGILSVLQRFVALKSHELVDSPVHLEFSQFDSDTKKPKNDSILLNPFNLKEVEQPHEEDRLVLKTWQRLFSDSSVASAASFESIDQVIEPDARHFDEEDDYELICLFNEVLTHLQQHLEYPVVQQFGLNTLSSLVFDDTSACTFLHTDGVNVILESLSDHPNETEILEIGCALLSDLACVDEFAELPQLAEIRRTLLRVINDHKEKCNICRWACSALEILSKLDTSQNIDETDTGVECIVSIMKQHTGHADIAECSIGALWELSLNHYCCSDSIVQNSGIDVIITVLLLHPYSQAIERDGFDVLSFILGDDSLGTTSDKEKQEVLDIVREYIDEATNGVLKNKNQFEQNSDKYQGWIATLSGVFLRRESGPVMQAYCTKVLHVLSVRKGACFILKASGVLEALVVGMDTYPMSEILQVYGCELFCDIACKKVLRKSILKAGAVHAIMKAMGSHLNSARVLQPACATLRNLSHDTDIRSDLIVAGVTPLALNAMVCHHLVSSIQEDCCGLLWNLALDDIGLEHVVSGGGVARILACMSQFYDQPLLQSDGCGALLAIITHENDVEDELLVQMTDVVGTAMATHGHNEVVQYYGQRLMEVATNLMAASSSFSSASSDQSSNSEMLSLSSSTSGSSSSENELSLSSRSSKMSASKQILLN